jgi:hypothetical protein
VGVAYIGTPGKMMMSIKNNLDFHPFVKRVECFIFAFLSFFLYMCTVSRVSRVLCEHACSCSLNFTTSKWTYISQEKHHVVQALCVMRKYDDTYVEVESSCVDRTY